MTKMLRRKTKINQHGITNESSPRYTKELERQEAKKEIEDQLEAVEEEIGLDTRNQKGTHIV